MSIFWSRKLSDGIHGRGVKNCRWNQCQCRCSRTNQILHLGVIRRDLQWGHLWLAGALSDREREEEDCLENWRWQIRQSVHQRYSVLPHPHPLLFWFIASTYHPTLCYLPYLFLALKFRIIIERTATSKWKISCFILAGLREVCVSSADEAYKVWNIVLAILRKS